MPAAEEEECMTIMSSGMNDAMATGDAIEKMFLEAMDALPGAIQNRIFFWGWRDLVKLVGRQVNFCSSSSDYIGNHMDWSLVPLYMSCPASQLDVGLLSSAIELVGKDFLQLLNTLTSMDPTYSMKKQCIVATFESAIADPTKLFPHLFSAYV